MGVDLKEIIFTELAKQREYLLAKEITKEGWANAEEYAEFIETIVFSEQDVLEQALASLDLDIHDIDPNEYRDYQHETVKNCVDWFKHCLERLENKPYSDYIGDKIMNKFESYAVGHYLRDWPEEWSYKKIIDELRSGDKGIATSHHYNYEGMPLEDLATVIEEMVGSLRKVFK